MCNCGEVVVEDRKPALVCDPSVVGFHPLEPDGKILGHRHERGVGTGGPCVLRQLNGCVGSHAARTDHDRLAPADAELTGGLMSPSLPARMLCLARIVAKGIYPEELVQHACLALAPGSYLCYKRRKLRTRGNAGVAWCLN